MFVSVITATEKEIAALSGYCRNIFTVAQIQKSKDSSFLWDLTNNLIYSVCGDRTVDDSMCSIGFSFP